MKIELCKSSVLMIFYAFLCWVIFRAVFWFFIDPNAPLLFTAISRKVLGKSARDNPEGIVGGFECTVL